MGKGTYNFGYYKDGVLVKDCTDEIFEPIHSRIVANSRNIQSKQENIQGGHMHSLQKGGFLWPI